jgi:4-hydroxy-tetrahydrodipicolinate reductase
VRDRAKVIQWATGNIGARSLRAVLEHPRMELVGLWVNSPEKVGKDAGQLCGLDVTTGIIATNDVDSLIALDADCVLHMPHGSDMDLWERLLASGKNVVTTRGDFHFPDALPDADRKRIEAACAAGGTSIYSTGVSPGFVTEALIVPLLSLSRRLEGVVIEEFANLETRNSPHLLFEVMGFGEEMRPFQQERADYLKGHFATSLAQVAKASGVEIDEWTAFGELAAASENVEIPAGTIRQGMVAAQRITISGMANGKPKFSFRAIWYATDRLTNVEWELRESGWRIRIESDTPMDVGITYPVAPEDYAAFTPGLTAHRAVNSVHAVCASAAGIRTTIDLPQVVADLGPPGRADA